MDAESGGHVELHWLNLRDETDRIQSSFQKALFCCCSLCFCLSACVSLSVALVNISVDGL